MKAHFIFHQPSFPLMSRFFQTTQLLRFSILAVLVLIALVVLSYLTRMDSKEEALTQQYIAEAKHQLEFTDREFGNVRMQLLSLTKVIASDYRVFDMLIEPTQEHKNVLEEAWFSVIENQHWFDEIRLIDEHGKELVVAEFEENTGTVSFESSDLLGDFSNNEVFRGFASSLSNSVSSWGITVRDEDQAIESARMYVSYPLSDNGVREGYVVVTFNIWKLVNALNYSPLNHIEAEIVDDEGYFFAAEDTHRLFGHVIDANAAHNIKRMYPKTWSNMQSGIAGVTHEYNTTIIYKRLSEISDDELVMGLVRISDDLIADSLKYQREAIISQSFTLVLVGVLMMVPGLYFFSQYQMRLLDSTLAKAALEGMSAVIIADESGRIVKVNNEFVNMTGYPASKVIGRQYDHLVVPASIEKVKQQREKALQNEGVWQGELMAVRADGSLIHTQLREQRGVKEKNFRFNIVSLIDISSQKALEEKLLYLSEHDALTEIWNRRKFDSELHKYASLKTRYPAKEPSALAIIDIDHFKAINDEHGHDVGDKVIQGVAKYFHDNLRVTDFVARVGGEEFAVIMPHTEKEVALSVLERLRENLALQDESLPAITVSVGVSDMSSSADDSYKQADNALYNAKQQGRNKVHLS
jgi:diguanylate cyclase (GGDEF)-like protein/PAS domain S-box-containing protein